MIRDFVLDPLLPIWVIALLGALAVLGALLTGGVRLKSLIPRTLAALIVCVALLNPQQVEEERQALPDVALIISDRTESMSIGERGTTRDAIASELTSQLNALENTDVVSVVISPSENGTRLSPALIEGISGLPRDRIGGVFILSDGIIHDGEGQLEGLTPDGVPVHSLIIGKTDDRDRRMNAINAPRFGLVDEFVDFEIQVDDPGFEGELALIQVRLNGVEQATFNVNIGEPVKIPVKVERRGSNTVELFAQGVDGELTYSNNIFVHELSGVRDRLRVLLITGEPHLGGRAWRNLLKSDPSVDLVHFTILRPPGKPQGAINEEMSLIAFPTRQLFEENVDEFDLIIFDQYERRNILSPYYFQNIARYVDNGGALLVSAGPPYAGFSSVYRSPLSLVLPAAATGDIYEKPYRPELTDAGRRHPITAGFAGETAERWGQWYRLIDSQRLSGDVLMEGPEGQPLLVLDNIGEGRVAMLLSDQAWLWARGHDGGGPYSETFRRLAHWLMGEPDLEAERLNARISGGTMTITRNTLSDGAQSVTVYDPDGNVQTVELTETATGEYSAQIEASRSGTYRVQTRSLQAIAAAGPLNPTELTELLPTDEHLAPLSESTGGFSSMIGEDATALPDLRKVSAGSDTMSGNGWAGIRDNGRYDVTASRRKPLAPVLLFFALAALMLAWAWRNEGR